MWIVRLLPTPPVSKRFWSLSLLVAASLLLEAITWLEFQELHQNAFSWADNIGVTGHPPDDCTEEKDSDKGRDKDRVLIAVSYLSAPANFKRRQLLRRHCFPQIRDSCREYAEKAGVKENTVCSVNIFVGQPVDPKAPLFRPDDKTLGVEFTDWEVNVSHRILDEVQNYGDVSVLPMRDMYRDLTNKVILIMKDGLFRNARNILKIDDDSCPDMNLLLPLANETKHNTAEYTGLYMFRVTDYPWFKDEVHFAPYMSGSGYMISAALAQALFGSHEESVATQQNYTPFTAEHVNLFMPYGTSTEDKNMGKWFERVQHMHPELVFSTREIRGMFKEVPADMSPAKVDKMPR